MMLEIVDQKRQVISRTIDPEMKSSLGQFMTPAPVASFMAGLFSKFSGKEIRLLDGGAGIGSLTVAFLERWVKAKNNAPKISVDAYEVDDILAAHFSKNIRDFKREHHKVGIEIQVIKEDFILDSARKHCSREFSNYTHAILNPPYRKIKSDSEHRLVLRSMGIEAVNLYSAFAEVAINRMVPGGEIVVIIPRSFCNGPYYKPFRKALLTKTVIKRIHLFGSRKRAFKDDDVLQENVILHLVKGGVSEEILLSNSTDSSFSDLSQFKGSINQIVNSADEELFIRIPAGKKQNSIHVSESVKFGLREIGLEVSTGPVVDFRAKEIVHKMPLQGDVPLLYPAHFDGYSVKWPKENIRKPNAIVETEESKKLFFPKGFYVLVKRFSSKEEKKRICAVVLSPKVVRTKVFGFENHLNVLHNGKTGLDEDLAYGLMVFLNSSKVDIYFREFNGHTQVNATDLRAMKYPSIRVLKALGKSGKSYKNLNQEKIDGMMARIV